MSPVIGTILLVGIVVILSAAVGTFVLGLGADLQSGAQAGVDVADISEDPTGPNGSATISVIGLENAEYVETTATVVTPNAQSIAHGGVEGDELRVTLADVGETATFSEVDNGSAGTTTVHLLAVAHSETDESVVMDLEVEI